MAVNRKKKLENKKRAPYDLPKLAKEANKFHKKADLHWIGLAESARKSGEALVKARYYGLWKRGRWEKWLEDNFDGSRETAKIYMRIAKKWKDPRLNEARRLGVTLNSINRIVEVLSGKRNTDGTLNIKKTEASKCRQELQKKFANALRDLEKEEILVFEEVFDCYWEKLSAKLYDDTCGVLEFDLDEYYLEQEKEQGLLNWTPKNNSRDASKGPPQKVMRAYDRELRVDERNENKKIARNKAKQALNRDMY